MKRHIQLYLAAMLGVMAGALITGCGTPRNVEFPDADRISQRQQISDRMGEISKSPYVR